MSATTQRRPHTFAPTDGSRTITVRDVQPRPENDDAGSGAGPSADPNAAVGVLKLRGAQRRSLQRVAWGTDVVDNEGCGKKKSKICCIYHKPRRFDESSSESEPEPESDLDSDEGSGRRYGDDRARSTKPCHHTHDSHGCGQHVMRHQPDADSNVNAYEKAPKRKA